MKAKKLENPIAIGYKDLIPIPLFNATVHANKLN